MRHMYAQVARIGRQGRFVIPAEIRRALALDAGTEVVVRVEDGSVIVEPLERAVAEVQAVVAGYLGDSGRSLVDELLEERRQEAADG